MKEPIIDFEQWWRTEFLKTFWLTTNFDLGIVSNRWKKLMNCNCIKNNLCVYVFSNLFIGVLSDSFLWTNFEIRKKYVFKMPICKSIQKLIFIQFNGFLKMYFVVCSLFFLSIKILKVEKKNFLSECFFIVT